MGMLDTLSCLFSARYKDLETVLTLFVDLDLDYFYEVNMTQLLVIMNEIARARDLPPETRCLALGFVTEMTDVYPILVRKSVPFVESVIPEFMDLMQMLEDAQDWGETVCK